MTGNGRKIAIVGGGIAGLCAGVYAARCGYEVEVLEMHEIAGGLATSWKRGEYTFETCLHWLYGSKPGSAMHRMWLEVCDLDRLEIVPIRKFGQIETADGESLAIWTDAGRLEEELLRRAPADAAQVRRFAAAIRRLSRFQMPEPGGNLLRNLWILAGDALLMPLLGELKKMSCAQYAERFRDPLVKKIFLGPMDELSALALFFSLAWMHAGEAAYAVGGALALIRLIEQRLESLGGKLRCGAKVERILVENDRAVGVELAGGERVTADWVISAADGHATIFEMLGGKYVDEAVRKRYNEPVLFPSYLQVSLGVARDLHGEPPMVTRLLKSPLQLDPATKLDQVSLRIFNYDPTFAPRGKTAVTSFLPTRNDTYWRELRQNDPDSYRAEKRRVAEAVTAVLESRLPGVREAIEAVDVSTPASIVRYTGNWKGSMEGWLPVAGSSFRPLPGTLPGLKRFRMVGQWVAPGGGLPSGPMTAKPAIQAIAKEDGVRFLSR
jgi:phytoene dehydrogenase-like protein